MLDERKRRRFDALVWSVSIAFGIIFPLTAGADGHRYGRPGPAYQAECGSCHIAYPPALMNAEGWSAIMDGLDRHFGTDASLDAAKRAELAGYLAAAAGARTAPRSMRITDASWFGKEHREIDVSTWTSPSVKSRSNCEACHRGAAAGDFNEDSIRLPRGVSK